MKNTLLILILAFSLNSYSQEKSFDLIEITLNYLKIKKENCLTEFIKNQKITESESIILIPEIVEKRDGYLTLNGHLIIVNNKNGKIKSSLSEKELWHSDALRLENIEVKYQPYKISKNFETIGIFINYSGSSRVNPYSSKELSLFVIKGEKLVKVLKDYPLYQFYGETNGMGNGEFEEHKKDIVSNLNSKSKFYNLTVADSIIKTESKEGIEKIIEKSKKIEYLKYENGKYKNVL
jgi:hypothetical protein